MEYLCFVTMQHTLTIALAVFEIRVIYSCTELKFLVVTWLYGMLIHFTALGYWNLTPKNAKHYLITFQISYIINSVTFIDWNICHLFTLADQYVFTAHLLCNETTHLEEYNLMYLQDEIFFFFSQSMICYKILVLYLIFDQISELYTILSEYKAIWNNILPLFQ